MTRLRYPTIKLTCQACGKEFLSERAVAKFCNGSCYGDAIRAKGGHRQPSDPVWRFQQKWQPNEVTGCWEWQGGVNHAGYGQFPCWKGKSSERAHRVAWQIYVGHIPEGMHVHHRCSADRPGIEYRRCVYPGHLYLGTHEDNMKDMAREGRGRSGCGGGKISKADADEVRSLGLSSREISEHLGLSMSHAWKIRKGGCWKAK